MSRFQVSKALVIQAANNAIKAVETRRKELFDAEVDKVLGRRFFKPKDRAEAETLVLEYSDQQANFKIRGWGIIATAEELQKACSVTTAEWVSLSTEDAAFVADWR